MFTMSTIAIIAITLITVAVITVSTNKKEEETMKELTKMIVEDAVEYGEYNIGSADRFGWDYINKQISEIRKYMEKNHINNIGIFCDNDENWILATI